MKELAKKRVYHNPASLFAFAFYAFLCFSATPAFAYTHINDVRIWTAPDHTRLVFDLSQSTTYKIFRLHNPERIVIDIANSRMQAKPASLALPDPVLLSIRHGKQKNGVTRIVLDVQKNVSPRSFLLKKSAKKPHRLVIDLIPKQKVVFKTKDIAKKGKHRDIIIAVDAGHGGEDPGATGKNKLKEKTVTLAVAKQLARLINAQPGMKAVLIRSGDYYVSLKKRVRKVRAINADMMISIHADAVTTRSVKGASVYTLSEDGATPDRVAAALAAKENAVDEIGGAMPEEVTDPLVRGILGDMAKRDGLDSSEMLANLMIKKLTGKFPIKYSKPKHARFAVLTTLEIPCILVEMDYISNPKRERLLKSKAHQKKLAKAMYSASVDFFTRMGRLTPHKATAHTHTVHRGESLWSIAKQYGVSVSSLKKLNQFKHSTLKVGQRIRLPQS